MSEIQAAWQSWRAARTAELARPHGWLSLTALHWLEPANPAKANVGQVLEGLPGRWWYDAEGIWADIPEGTTPPLLLAGVPVAGPTLLWAVVGPAPELSLGEVSVELIERGEGNRGVRIHDPHSPQLTGFTGVPVFDYDPRWRLPAVYRPYSDAETVTVGTVVERVPASRDLVGEVDLEIDGVQVTLKVAADQVIPFFDASNGVETTPQFRSVKLSLDPDIVDFNFAADQPCSFTPYGTCPLPPAGNRIPVKILAGEKPLVVP